MYNTRSSSGNYGNQPNRQSQNYRQPQPEFVHVATLVNSPINSTSPIQHQSMQSITAHNVQRPQSPQIQVQSPITQCQDIKSELSDNWNDSSNVEDIIEESRNEKVEVKWPPKRKPNKKEQKKRLNARIRRLVCPKSPLMVFSELYKDTPITLQEQHSHNTFTHYTASIEIDGTVYTGDHVSKTQAKQKACENFLRVMLAKKMNEKKEEPEPENNSDIVEESGSATKPKGPPMEDFPWPHFASLAMHNLINLWELQPAVSRVISEEITNKTPQKAAGMKKFPDNPQNYNPVQLLHQMIPGIKFEEKTVSTNNPTVFLVSCVVNGVLFNGQGSTKKGAKKECAIAAIKYTWKFDFHTNKTVN